MAHGLLENAVVCLTPDYNDEHDPRKAPPDRRYVADTTPAADDEQLTVHIPGIKVMEPSVPSKAAKGLLPRATFVLTLFRCRYTPDKSGAPDANSLDEDGTQRSIDMYALLVGLADLWLAGTLFGDDNPIGPESVNWRQSVTNLSPSADLGGFTITFEADIS